MLFFSGLFILETGRLRCTLDWIVGFAWVFFTVNYRKLIYFMLLWPLGLCNFLLPLTLRLTSLLCGNKNKAPVRSHAQFFIFFLFLSALRQWHDEQETHLGQRAGSTGLPGMAVQKEGEQRLPGYQVEEVLVCAEKDVALLVHQPAGEIINCSHSFPLG